MSESLLMFELIGTLIVGLAAGWAATRLMGAGNAGWLAMLVVGVVGSFVGPWALLLVGFETVGFPGSLIAAVIGAVLCILALRYLAPKF